jgi:PAS domain S-box-containing protein
MAFDELSDLVGSGVEVDGAADEPATIFPLVADSGNRRVLREWLADQEEYETVEPGPRPFEAAFDLCIIDDEALREYREELQASKAEAEPILLPVLLLLPEARSDVIDVDRGDIADNVFATTIDEIVSLPIRQTELEWRIQSLLRLRSQSLTSQARTEELRLFRQAVEATGYAIYITDTDGRIRYVNAAFEEITGYSREEAIGETTRLLRSGEMSEAYYANLWETVRSGEVWEGDIVDRRKNGELYTAAQTIAPVSEGGEVLAFVAVQNDITEREKRAEILERRTQAIEEAPVGISITDPGREDNPMIYVNDRFVEMTGYPREEAIGRNCRFLQGENTDPDRVARIRAAIDAQEPVAIDLRNYRKDGTEFWNHLEIAPVTDGDGTVTNWVGFQQDVTERKQRLKQLGVLDRTLRHNLRNELNVVKGRAELIGSRTSGEIAASAGQIVETSDRLAAMAEKEQAITALLREAPRHKAIELGPVLERVAEANRMEFDDATIRLDCPDGATVSASTELDRAIDELVTNAVVHNDSPAPEVTVSVTEQDGGVRIEVADDGPPIPEMEWGILSNQDRQTPLYHGSGLGLWLVGLIVSRSGGTIDFAENTPRGNRISIEL